MAVLPAALAEPLRLHKVIAKQQEPQAATVLLAQVYRPVPVVLERMAVPEEIPLAQERTMATTVRHLVVEEADHAHRSTTVTGPVVLARLVA